MALKFMDESGNGSTANAISCIDYAVYKGAKVLSNSWGWYNYDEDLEVEIEVANSEGVLFVAAAGNEGFSYPRYPARFNCSNIISVLMTNNNDTKAPGSNYGADSVDLGAPGTNILSCEPNGQYAYHSGGTSLSTPYVAGACALVWSLNPSLSHLEVKNIILNSVDQKSDLSGRCVTGGRLNLYNALAATPHLLLDKVDDINDSNGVYPGDDVNYIISYHNPPVGSPSYIGIVDNAVITDYLPVDLIFVSATGPNNVYHSHSRTITWNIGTLEPNESGSVTLTVKVNACITSSGLITNVCKIEGGDLSRWASEDTPVLCASNPRPTCAEITDFLCTGEPNLNLSWCPGRFAAHTNGHEVYFGTDFYAVRDANTSTPNIYKATVSNPSYPIEANKIELGTNYYWRIDEVNDANVWKGTVWGFSADCYLLENWNSYANPDALRVVWKDYYTQEPPKTSAECYTEQTIVRSGSSMRYWFRNEQYEPYYSEVRANVVTNGLGKDPNWLGMNAKVLSLWFRGLSSNPVTEPMYIKLVDGASQTAMATYPDSNDLKVESWQQWNIPLQDFVDNNPNFNLSNVARIIIRFGDPPAADSNGTVYFDDLRLYLKKCFPGSYPKCDFEPDCIIDFYDYAVLASAWLTDDPAVSLDGDDDVDMYDLARFCYDWLWQQGGDIQQQMFESQQSGDSFGAVVSEPQQETPAEPQQEDAPPEQQQIQDESSEELDIEQINEIMEFLQTWLADEQLKQQIIEEEGQQAWLEFSNMLEDWMNELSALSQN